jgi:hypothetical protein
VKNRAQIGRTASNTVIHTFWLPGSVMSGKLESKMTSAQGCGWQPLEHVAYLGKVALYDRDSISNEYLCTSEPIFHVTYSGNAVRGKALTNGSSLYQIEALRFVVDIYVIVEPVPCLFLKDSRFDGHPV